jgi:riboflavin kinase/FMN adenylyltransferase
VAASQSILPVLINDFMRHYHNLEDVNLNGAWASVGTFDGVHLGHQSLLSVLTAGAASAGVPSVVLTFHPHPGIVLGKRNKLTYLSLPTERARLLGELGVDIVITQTFDHNFASLTAYQFMRLLSRHLRANHLVVGHDFALGRGREGTASILGDLGHELGYKIIQVAQISMNGVVISSSIIRSSLANGDIEKATSMLGRPYRLSGIVVGGDHRGRVIGIPTANIDFDQGCVIPKTGVYACRAWLGSISWAAVANIGYRPTFEDQSVQPRVEAHLLDFDRDIYGSELQLEFISRLRDEQRFSGIEALVEQIRKDISKARLLLET